MASKFLSHLPTLNPSSRQPIFPNPRPSLPLFKSSVHLSLRQYPSFSSSLSTPPSSREEAISQAKISLSTTLRKPLNNISPLPSKKLKRQKQPRFSVEIPLADDSPNSLSKLVFDVFSDLPIKRKGEKASILIVWPNQEASELAHQIFSSNSSGLTVENKSFGNLSSLNLNSIDMGVLIGPEPAMIDQLRSFCEDLYPKPVVLLNPKWGLEEEIGAFSGSFEVVYSFAGLEVQGLLSRRKGAVFRCVKDGVFSGEGWEVLVEDEEKKGEMKAVMKFRKRPSMAEVENVLYNLMAANSPVTKSVKFFKELVSNVQRGVGGK